MVTPALAKARAAQLAVQRAAGVVVPGEEAGEKDKEKERERERERDRDGRDGMGRRRGAMRRPLMDSYRPSRSPSPDRALMRALQADKERVGARRGEKGKVLGGAGPGGAGAEAEAERARVLVNELAGNGREHLCLKVDGDGVRDEDVMAFCEGFVVEKVRHGVCGDVI
jgi:ribosomal protein L12E/L44/L45/RPP1/RPP2